MPDITFGAGPVVGADCKLYYNTGTRSSETWVEVDEVGDVNMPELSVALAALKRRANSYTKNLPALFNSITINATLIHGLGPTEFAAIQTQFFAKTCVEWAILGGAYTNTSEGGVQGLRIPMLVSAFPWNQPLEDVAGHEITLASGLLIEGSGSSETEIDPVWTTVGGSPGF